MYKNLKIVKVDSNYCDYLRQFDNKVPYNYNNKELKPFIGILFKVEDVEYFAPLSSPKEKHKKIRNTLDLIKIKDWKYGVVNINNMIPVTSNNYVEFDLKKHSANKSELLRIELLTNQLRWLTVNRKKLFTKSRLLYNLYRSNKLHNNIKDRCCNYPLPEEKCTEYNNSKTLLEV